MITLKNPWYDKTNCYSKESFTLENNFVEHKGYNIHLDNICQGCAFIVKDGAVVSQCVTVNGAIRHINSGLYLK